MGVKYTIYFNLVLENAPKEQYAFFPEWIGVVQELEIIERGINFPSGFKGDGVVFIHGELYCSNAALDKFLDKLKELKPHTKTASVWGYNDIGYSNESLVNYLEES